jgi:hypothetical protein
MLVELDCLHYSKVFAFHFSEQAVGANLFRKKEQIRAERVAQRFRENPFPPEKARANTPLNQEGTKEHKGFTWLGLSLPAHARVEHVA